MEEKAKILLTFDLEEFDLPLEYGQPIDKDRQISISTAGLQVLLSILKEYDIDATFFTTAYYAECQPQLIERIASRHEVASHMYYHSDYDRAHVHTSKLKLEEISNTKIYGIRMPRLQQVDRKKIKEAGYLYDSSLNPTFLPGRYNHLKSKRVLHTDLTTGLLILPMSTSIIRIPLFWLSFKNFHLAFYEYLCRFAIRKDSYLHLYFHPWEFADLSPYRIPSFIKRNSGVKMEQRFRWLIDKFFAGKYDFMRVIDFIQAQSHIS